MGDHDSPDGAIHPPGELVIHAARVSARQALQLAANL